MGKNPAMQFYVNDWLSSPTVLMMTPLQELAFFRMLLFCWSSGDASITGDVDTLATLTRTDANTCSTVVEQAFNEHPTKAGFLTNDRLFGLWQERVEFNRQRSEAGKKSGQARRKSSSGKPVSSTEQALNKRSTRTTVPVGVSLNSSSSSSSSIKPPKSPSGDFLEAASLEDLWNRHVIRHDIDDDRAAAQWSQLTSWPEPEARDAILAAFARNSPRISRPKKREPNGKPAADKTTEAECLRVQIVKAGRKAGKSADEIEFAVNKELTARGLLEAVK